MNYLRALMALQEHSHRALALTTHVLMLNASQYTVWQYRRLLLLQLLKL